MECPDLPSLGAGAVTQVPCQRFLYTGTHFIFVEGVLHKLQSAMVSFFYCVACCLPREDGSDTVDLSAQTPESIRRS